jgi:hypothetical protein
MQWLMLVLLRERSWGELDGEFEADADAKSSIEGAGKKEKR